MRLPLLAMRELQGTFCSASTANVESYVDAVRIPVLVSKKTTTIVPELESLRLYSERANVFMGYWQDSLHKSMPRRDLNSKKRVGCGVSTRIGTGTRWEQLTTQNFLLAV